MTSVSPSSLPPSPLRQSAPAAPRLPQAAPAAEAGVRGSSGAAEVAKPIAQALANATRAASTASTPPSTALATPSAAQAAAAKELSKEEVAKQVHELQAKMDKLNPALAFVVDKDSGRTLIQLTDRATKEVILQFPSEAALQISKALDQFQKGQLISRTV